MAKIIVRRNSEMNNRFREIGLYIDGEKVGTINDGETREYEVSDANHEVYARIDWCGSQKLKLDTTKGELTTLNLSGFKFGKWLMPILLSLLALVIVLSYFFNVPLIYIFWIPALTILYPMYYITVGRNRYLLLKKGENL